MNVSAFLRAPGLLSSGLRAAQRAPIFLVGIPRTGSSWVGAMLSTAAGVRYFREPFNTQRRAEAEPFHLRYLRRDDVNPAFDAYCRRAFAGGVRGKDIERHAWTVYNRLRWWPGRMLVKEVHTGLALERVEAIMHPRVAVIVRHPCAVAASWARLRELRPDDPHWRTTREQLDLLLSQETLMRDHLAPFEHVMRDAATYFQQVGALWGAFYQTVLGQQRLHPDWIVVHHEALCDDPRTHFEELFGALDLEWTERTDALLAERSASERPGGPNPYDVRRDPSGQADKWRDELSDEEQRDVLSTASTFYIAAASAGL